MGVHLSWLDALRALAALWVVVHHAFLTVDFEPHQRLTRALWLLLMRGHYAVTAFIAISGFSLALSPSKNGWQLKNGYREYLVARWMRIVPAYYASIALSLVLIATIIGRKTGTHWDISIPVDRSAIVAHLLMVQNFFRGGAINHVYWSVAVESQIYVLFGLVLLAMRRGGYIGVAAISLALFELFAWLHVEFMRHAPVTYAVDNGALALYIPVFAFGVCACRFFREASRPLPWGWAVACLAAMAKAAQYEPGPYTYLAFGAGFAALLAVVSTNTQVAGLLATRPLPQIGKISYSLYLVHAPFLQVLYVVVGAWRPHESLLRFLSFVIAGLLFSILVGWGFYHTVERPFDRIRHFKRKETPTSV